MLVKLAAEAALFHGEVLNTRDVITFLAFWELMTLLSATVILVAPDLKEELPVLYLRLRRQEAVGTDDFLALGLIALSYGAALAENFMWGSQTSVAQQAASRKWSTTAACGWWTGWWATGWPSAGPGPTGGRSP